eukprot:COSAG04_NODE_48_length_31217_cov_204.046758_3_plen_73_part_00
MLAISLQFCTRRHKGRDGMALTALPGAGLAVREHAAVGSIEEIRDSIGCGVAVHLLLRRRACIHTHSVKLSD